MFSGKKRRRKQLKIIPQRNQFIIHIYKYEGFLSVSHKIYDLWKEGKVRN